MSAWFDELEEALAEPRLDRVEQLRNRRPTFVDVEPDQLRRIVERVATLLGRRPDAAPQTERLAWWLDALLLQRVIRLPPSPERRLFPVLFVALTVLLGLLVGRLAAAGVMVIGFLIWAARHGGSVQTRHGDWLRLDDLVIDLRHARIERIDDEWVLIEGQRVRASVLASGR